MFSCTYGRPARWKMRTSVLLLLLFWCVTPCAAVSGPVGGAEEKVYYVQPSNYYREPCGEKRPCKSVQEYINENPTIFQTSSVTWVFLEGKHVLREPLVMRNVHNVTLTGQPTLMRGTCTLSSHVCIFLQNASSVTLQYLTVEGYVHPNCPAFVGMKDSVQSLIIRNCSFRQIGPVVNITSDLSKDCGRHFDILVHGCAFSGGSMNYFHGSLIIHLEYCKKDPKLHIRVEFCYFFFGPAISFHLINSSLSSYTVQIEKCWFYYSVHSTEPIVSVLLPIPYLPPEYLHFGDGERIVNISDCKFTVFLSQAIFVQYTVDSDCHLNPQHLPHHDIQPLVGRVEIGNCVFESVTSKCPVIESSIIDPCVKLATLGSPSPVILLLNRNTVFGQKTLPKPLTHPHLASFELVRSEFHQLILKNYSLYLTGVKFSDFRRFYASMAQNIVKCFPGTGLALSNAHIEFNGYNAVYLNGYLFSNQHNIEWTIQRFGVPVPPETLELSLTPESHGVSLTPDSLLLLHNNATFYIFGNRGAPVGGGVYVSPNEPNTSCLAHSYTKANMSTESCPDLCFFQLVDSSGGFIDRESIPFHHATLILEANDAESAIGKDIFNGHLSTCSMWTPSGLLTLDESEKKRFLATGSRAFPYISSYPYFICICTDFFAEQADCSLEKWEKLIYPEPLLDLYIMVTGDYNYTVPSVVVIHVNGALYDRIYMDASVVSTCWKVSLHVDICRLSSENEVINISLLAMMNVQLMAEKPQSIHRDVLLTFAKRCPPGFHQHNESEGCFTCTCNLALQHPIDCTLREDEAVLTVAKDHYWLGVDEGTEHLLLSTYCPPYFCQGSPRELVIKKLPNSYFIKEQCQNSRQGILCSQCPEGQSSVFGSFHCQLCSHLWLLLVPVFAAVGILLLLFILLCNFTILQGTTHGIIVYTSIMNLGIDLYSAGSSNGWTVPLALMNLDLGVHLCLYNGLDEFAKAVLQFAFPAYLLIILIVTTVFTHKYGYKLHRISIIAKRIVPVLATLVIITYTKLAAASVNGLLLTWMYDIDSQKSKAVWLYDGSVGYFEGKHIFLALLSIACIVLYILPVAIVALFGDLLRWCVHYHWLSHFIDVFHGSFRRPFGFWLGVRLLAILLLVGLKIPFSGTHFTYCISIVVGLVLIVQIILRPFKPFEYPLPEDGPHYTLKMCIVKVLRVLVQPTLLDALFLFNMTVANMSFWIPSSSSSGAPASPSIAVSISVALALLAGVLVYHAYSFFPLPERVKDALKRLLFCCVERCAREEPQSEEENMEPLLLDPTEGFPPSFLRITELRPPTSANDSSTEEATTET